MFEHQSFSFLISMQNIADFVNSAISNYHIDSSIIQDVQACLNEEMKVDGWISFIFSNKECTMLNFNNGVFMNEGFVVNDQKVLKVLGNHQIGGISYSNGVVVEGIVDLDHGSRFEGLVLTDEKEGKIGIPFGFGKVYDDDGVLLYKGIMINWKRFGYGTSYHDNGFVEYEGYWCDDNRFGSGKVYDRKNRMVNNCTWCNGRESDECIGDGETVYFAVKRLTLNNSCKWKVFDINLLESLEFLHIGDDCCSSVRSFRVVGLGKLKKIVIGNNSFTLAKNYYGSAEHRSFELADCEQLVSVDIGSFCFSDCTGDFVLHNLPSLQSINIGSYSSPSYDFYFFSFVAKGNFLVF